MGTTILTTEEISNFAQTNGIHAVCIMPQKCEQLDGWVYGCETCQSGCPLNKKANHRHEAVVLSETRIGEMTLLNTAIVSKENIKSGLKLITSPSYQKYIKKLLGENV